MRIMMLRRTTAMTNCAGTIVFVAVRMDDYFWRNLLEYSPCHKRIVTIVREPLGHVDLVVNIFCLLEGSLLFDSK